MQMPWINMMISVDLEQNELSAGLKIDSINRSKNERNFDQREDNYSRGVCFFGRMVGKAVSPSV